MTTAPEQSVEQKLRDATEVKFSIRALLVVMAVLAVSFSALAAFIRHFPADVQSRLVVLWSLLGAFLIALCAYQARRRYVAEKQAGHVLMSLIPHSYFIPKAPDFARVLCGALLFAVGPGFWIAYSFTIAAAPPGQGMFPVEPYMLYGLVGSSAGLTCLWWRRVRIGENGLVLRSSFHPWKEYAGWYWDACHKDVAVLRRYLRGGIPLRVPARDRSALELLLNEKLADE